MKTNTKIIIILISIIIILLLQLLILENNNLKLKYCNTQEGYIKIIPIHNTTYNKELNMNIYNEIKTNYECYNYITKYSTNLSSSKYNIRIITKTGEIK